MEGKCKWMFQKRFLGRWLMVGAGGLGTWVGVVSKASY